MPSLNMTKTNIDRSLKEVVRNQGKLEGLSLTKMLAKMIHFYMQHKEEN